MRKIQVNLDEIQDEEFVRMYDVFGLDVQNKSYEDFERRMLKIQLDTIVEIKNRERNLYSCPKWIFIFQDIQQTSDCIYCIWGA